MSGDDTVSGDAGYDVYYFGREHGSDVIDDNAAGDNGLVVYWGDTDNGVTPADVTFSDNGNGTWTIAFNSGEGDVTFKSSEISDINLFDSVGGVSVVTEYEWNGSEYEII